MAWDEGLAQLLRDDLAADPAGGAVTEKKMFGGLAFLLHGHMVCGIHKGGAMFRVGKPNEAAALAVP
ncbi:MAG TPA: TfoX/Sxy family protein, partial [Paracoccaceae bacterium]